jgi:hypothetical protein
MLVIPLEVVMGWAWFCGKSRPHNLRRASTTMLSHGFLRVCSNCQSSCVKHIITDIEIHCKLWIPNFFSLEHWKQRQMNSANLNKWNVISAGCKLWPTEAVFLILLGLVKTTLCPGDLQVQTQFYPIWRLYFIWSTVYRPCYSCEWICSYIWWVSSTISNSS